MRAWRRVLAAVLSGVPAVVVQGRYQPLTQQVLIFATGFSVAYFFFGAVLSVNM